MLDGQRLIAFSGKRESGKDTSVNFLHSLAIFHHKISPRAFLDEKTGQIIVQTSVDKDQLGVLDLSNRNSEYLEWAYTNLFPFVRRYSFADILKEFCIDALGLSEEQVYGTNEQKDTPTKYLWEDMPVPPGHFQKTKVNKIEPTLYVRTTEEKTGFMTGREIMQYFGTEIGRQMHKNIWAEACIRRIIKEQSGQACINDCRFPNEVEAVKNAGGKVIRLTRTLHPEDTHYSETALDEDKYDWGNFDAVIRNDDKNIYETCDEIFDLLKKWQWIETGE